MMTARKMKVKRKRPDPLLRKSLKHSMIVQMKKKMKTAKKNPQRRKHKSLVNLRKRRRVKKKRAPRRMSHPRKVGKIMKPKTNIKMR